MVLVETPDHNIAIPTALLPLYFCWHLRNWKDLVEYTYLYIHLVWQMNRHPFFKSTTLVAWLPTCIRWQGSGKKYIYVYISQTLRLIFLATVRDRNLTAHVRLFIFSCFQLVMQLFHACMRITSISSWWPWCCNLVIDILGGRCFSFSTSLMISL